MPKASSTSAPRHVLVTGGAGFIGSHVVDALLGQGRAVTAIDNFDPFYDAGVKRQNLASAAGHPGFRLIEGDVRDAAALAALPDDIDAVVHLAALAGVRPSIARPVEYVDVNVRGTQVLLEWARVRRIPQFVFASSSSVYGIDPDVPWRESDVGLRPISPYAATKVSGELLGHSYSHLSGLRFIALRFFTVYGPRQRPDLAIHRFATLMRRGEPIPVYGDPAATRRDYTYIDDVVSGVVASVDYRASDYEVINLGNASPVSLRELLDALESALHVEGRIEPLPPQPGDVPQTWADVSKAGRLLGYSPSTPLAVGLERFARWLDAHEEASSGAIRQR